MAEPMFSTNSLKPETLSVPAEAGLRNQLIDPDGELHRRYGASREGLYLMRPDGYVGFRSQPADVSALRAYLDRLFVE